jgi:hypothetical protein
MDYTQLRKTVSQRKQKNRQASEDVFKEAAILAAANLCALNRMPNDYHFQLIKINGDKPDYIYNLYPSTQRIYSDPKHRGPFLQIPKPWTILDVVKALVKDRK